MEELRLALVGFLKEATVYLARQNAGVAGETSEPVTREKILEGVAECSGVTPQLAGKAEGTGKRGRPKKEKPAEVVEQAPAATAMTEKDSSELAFAAASQLMNDFPIIGEGGKREGWHLAKKILAEAFGGVAMATLTHEQRIAFAAACKNVKRPVEA